MNDKKQIEEMASIIQGVAERHHGIWCKELAKIIYNADYRKQEWISVEERLPKQWETVLVFCDDIISTDFIASSGRWYEHIDHDAVTHWMPLPEPPKGGAE